MTEYVDIVRFYKAYIGKLEDIGICDSLQQYKYFLESSPDLNDYGKRRREFLNAY